MQIGRLEPVSLRELWPSEARDFTTWLAENLDFLGEKLGVELSLVEQEASAGVFSADILAEDGSGNPVVIENQLERTDHDHLGKLITYLSNLDAKTAVWITSNPRPEHEQAIHWLNQVLPADMAFYLVKIEAYRIEGSPSASLLTVVAGPTPEARQVGTQKKELAKRHILRREFWAQLLERAKERTLLHARRAPTANSSLNAGSGKAGIVFQYRIRMDDAEVALRIRRDTVEESKRIFDSLYANRDTIERAFGDRLEWLRLDDVRNCRITYVISFGGLRDRDCWPEIQDRMIDAMVRLERALGPEIRRLK
jgi:hypothetical protein